MDDHRVSVVMPAYGLADTIYDNLMQTRRVVGPSVEIVAVDDGSADATHSEMLRAASVDGAILVARNDVNQGKGSALRKGFKLSTGDIVVLLDGDLDLPPEQLPAVLGEFERTGIDVLVGSKDAAMRAGHYPLKRRVLSRVFSVVSRLLFRLPVTETQTGLKVIRRAVLDGVFDEVRIVRYAFDLELLVRARMAGFSIAQTPVELRPNASSAPLHLGTLWEMGRDTARIFLWSLRRN